MGTNQNKRPHSQNLYIQHNYNSIDSNHQHHYLLIFINKYNIATCFDQSLVIVRPVRCIKIKLQLQINVMFRLKSQ